MSEISRKIEALRAAGFEPITILMTRDFFNDLTEPRFLFNENHCEAVMLIPDNFEGIPIKIKEDPSHILYSIEVA